MYYLMNFPNGYVKGKKEQAVSAQPISKPILAGFFGFHLLFLLLNIYYFFYFFFMSQ